jgi:enoyl-CoA hydratase/carnithine racemase
VKEAVRIERHGAVFVVHLGETEADENRFDPQLLDGLHRAFDAVEEAADAALVTVGSDRFYSNGYDLDWLATLDRDGRRAFIRDQQALLARLMVLPVPTVAAVSGHAFGAGALLAMAHDRRIVREAHGFFCLPEIDARIPLRRGMMSLLQDRLPARTVRDAVLTGRRYAAAEAVAAGIAQESCPIDDLVERARELASGHGGKAGSALSLLKRGLHARAHAELSGVDG